MADDHYVSAHLQVEERGGHMASRGPSVDTSLGLNIFFKFAHSQRPLLELLQDFPPQFWVLLLPLPGSVPPSSPRLGEGFRISSHQRMVERVVFGGTIEAAWDQCSKSFFSSQSRRSRSDKRNGPSRLQRAITWDGATTLTGSS